MSKLNESPETIEAVAPALNSNFAVNSNYKGIDEKSTIEKAGLKYSEPVNRSLIINSVERIVKDDRAFYAIKADDAITDNPCDCSISEHHYNAFGFSELLPLGRHAGKVIKVKGIFADTNTGYYDKTSGNVLAYWKTGFFVTEPRSEVTEKELSEKRRIDNEATQLERNLQRLLGGKFDYTNPQHLAVLTAMSK